MKCDLCKKIIDEKDERFGIFLSQHIILTTCKACDSEYLSNKKKSSEDSMLRLLKKQFNVEHIERTKFSEWKDRCNENSRKLDDMACLRKANMCEYIVKYGYGT